MSSLSSYIKTSFGVTESTQFYEDCDSIGDQVVSIIQQLYSTKTNPCPTGCYNTLVLNLQSTDPPKDSNTLAYYVTQGFALGLDLQLAAAQIYLTAGTPPPPPPYVYTAGAITALMQAKIIEGVIALNMGTSITLQVTILITAFDSFLVEKFASPV